MTGMPTADNAPSAELCFGSNVIHCPFCGHGIDPHGIDPGGPCGTSGCPCLMQPNGIAEYLIREAGR